METIRHISDRRDIRRRGHPALAPDLSEFVVNLHALQFRYYSALKNVTITLLDHGTRHILRVTSLLVEARAWNDPYR
jgi:hypothetical protein